MLNNLNLILSTTILLGIPGISYCYVTQTRFDKTITIKTT